MRCKACNSEMSVSDHARKDKATGEFLDLCGGCYKASQGFVYEVRHMIDPVEVDVTEPPTRPVSKAQMFEDYVQKHNLRASWADGLGLMDPEKRINHMYYRGLDTFERLLQEGERVPRALERATGKIIRINT